MKKKLQTILVILCIIFLKTVNVTYSFNGLGNAKAEMALTVKVSPPVLVPDWLVHQFFSEDQLAFSREF